MLTQEIKKQIKEISLKTNNEACGFLLNNKIYPCKNQSPEPEKHFKISSFDYLTASYLGKIHAIYHSHTKNPDFSEFDKINLFNLKMRGILYCKETDSFKIFLPESYNNKYVGRKFEIGVSDCLSLISDYYKNELNIELPKISRTEEWYKKTPNIINESIPQNLKKITFKESKKNDILIFDTLKKGEPCHLGIYLDNDIILHQSRNKLSTIELLTDAMKDKISYALTLK